MSASVAAGLQLGGCEDVTDEQGGALDRLLKWLRWGSDVEGWEGVCGAGVRVEGRNIEG